MTVTVRDDFTVDVERVGLGVVMASLNRRADNDGKSVDPPPEAA